MGMRDFLKNARKKAEDRLNPKPLTPEEEKTRKKETAQRQFNQMNKAMEMAKKGLKIKGDVDRKTNAIKDGLARKTIEVTEKLGISKDDAERADTPAKPAEKKPGILVRAGKGLADGARDLVDDAKDAQARKPSTKSSLLDLIVPAVPETDATKPKTPPADKPAAKPRRAPPKK